MLVRLSAGYRTFCNPSVEISCISNRCHFDGKVMGDNRVINHYLTSANNVNFANILYAGFYILLGTVENWNTAHSW